MTDLEFVTRMQQFHVMHTAELLQVHKRTLMHWVKNGKIKGRQSQSGRWLFSLEEINRVRVDRGYKPLTKEEAKKFWENWKGKKNDSTG